VRAVGELDRDTVVAFVETAGAGVSLEDPEREAAGAAARRVLEERIGDARAERLRIDEQMVEQVRDRGEPLKRPAGLVGSHFLRLEQASEERLVLFSRVQHRQERDGPERALEQCGDRGNVFRRGSSNHARTVRGCRATETSPCA
jgi:hypothetical protein